MRRKKESFIGRASVSRIRRKNAMTKNSFVEETAVELANIFVVSIADHDMTSTPDEIVCHARQPFLVVPSE